MKLVDLAGKKCIERAAAAQQHHNFSHAHQIDILNNMFLGGDEPVCHTLVRELGKKRYGYYQQDLRKKRVVDISGVLTMNELEDKLVASKLRCLYCRQGVLLFYRHVREPRQWTLDRIDNEQPHTSINTCVACLECNLTRRVTSHSGYIFTKNLTIRKLD
jgi:hypothetical protein